MNGESAERWIKLAIGPAGALVILIAAVVALWFRLSHEIKTGIGNQTIILEAQLEQRRITKEHLAATLETNDLLKQQIVAERRLADRIELWLFRNFDSPKQP